MAISNLGPALSATLITPNLEKSIEAYCSFLHQHVYSKGEIDASQAESWQSPALTGRPYVWLANEIDEPWLRLIEDPDAESFEPFRHTGWMSLEISVLDVDALRQELEHSPFIIIGEPAELDVSDDIRAMQVIGPAGEVLYLTQIKAEVPPFELPFARCAVDRLFIPVMLAPNRDETLAVYEQLGGNDGLKFETKITVINSARQMDFEKKHPVACIQLAGCSLIEIDQLDGLQPKMHSSDSLPPGIAFISFQTVELPTSSPRQELTNGPWQGGKTTMLTGAAGELIELIEFQT